ncbi:MAG: hypothetical protein KKE17_14025 [Proteobacteria bacterium]|nr:hypothetical protein [Pseudomonadota bacterium]MBU1711117.1 hypothetical protein [Pseudomonadota bacterium]
MNIDHERKQTKSKWYENYLPFIARSPEMQIKWLVSVFRKGTLTDQEITPYIRLLLTEESEYRMVHLKELFKDVEPSVLTKMLLAADIYDTIKLMGILPDPIVSDLVIALKKTPPPYEKNKELLVDRLYKTIYDRSHGLLDKAAGLILSTDNIPENFEFAYGRFKEIIRDEELLSSLFPRAKV